MKVCSLALILATAAATPLAAQHGVEGLSNPYNTPEDVAAGGRLFRSHCGVCHGPVGEGGRAPSLTTGRFRHGSDDSSVYRTISEGIPGTEMPATFFNGRQLWQLVAFSRSLSEGKAAEQIDGNPDKGRMIFAGKGGCTNCHMAEGQGRRTAPDLSDIGKRSLADLESSILRPNEKVLPRHWVAKGVTKDGKTIQGMRLNEDTHSVQLIDQNEKLVSLAKADLSSFEVIKTSTMPSFDGTFSKSELNDLMAYLASLRKN